MGLACNKGTTKYCNNSWWHCDYYLIYKGKQYSTEQKDDTKEIIGEDTLEGKKDKKGNIQRDLISGPFVDTKDPSKLVKNPDQEKSIPKSSKTSTFIEQLHPMTVKADSLKSDTTYYSPKKKKSKK